MSGSCSGNSAEKAAAQPASIYRCRRPERTVVYQVLQEHMETWLAQYTETEGDPVPRHVERDLRKYLECGILAHGFARSHDCDHYGNEKSQSPTSK